VADVRSVTDLRPSHIDLNMSSSFLVKVYILCNNC
jgi:hypothetical protein